ncbi:MAG: amidohydrolase family protein, partial [Candidatus Hodarchaeales archaeon]
MTDILIKSPRAIVPVSGSMNEPIILKNQSILISEDNIHEIGENISTPQGCEILDATGKVVVPGLINSHTHLSMNLLKGYADDMILYEWLTEEIWPFEAKMTAEDVEFGAKLGAFESIASGTTCVNSMYHNSDREIKAISELGLRGVIGHNCFSWRREEDYKATKNLIEKHHRSLNDLIRCNITPHSGYTVDYDFLKQLIELRDHYREKYT